MANACRISFDVMGVKVLFMTLVYRLIKIEKDCDDGSDERDCPLCQEIRQFKCLKTAKCIPG